MNKIHCFLLFFTAISSAWGGIQLPAVFSDSMVLQRDKPVPVWGTAEPGAEIVLEFKDRKKATHADSSGKWRITLPPEQADDRGAAMTIRSGNEARTIRDIVIGEVWIMAGQSQIELSYGGKKRELQTIDLRYIGKELSDKIAEEIDRTMAGSTPDPLLRRCRVRNNPHAGWGWVKSDSKTLPGFSIMQHQMGVCLRKSLKVPVGMIDISRGCSSIENWIPEEYFNIPCLAAAREDIEPLRKFRLKYESKNISETEKSEFFTRHCNRPEYGQQHCLKDGKATTEFYPWLWQHIQAVTPAAGYDRVVTSVLPYAAKGFIWWQGETNYGDEYYAEKFLHMVEAWRKRWNAPELPFIMILQGYRPQYAEKINPFRLQQYQAADTGKNIYLVNNLETPPEERPLVHPCHDKIQAGKETAQLLLTRFHGASGNGCGPFFSSVEINGPKATVSFRFAEGLHTRDEKAPIGFELAGADLKFVKADAVLQNDQVVLSVPGLTEPRYIRFLWDEENAFPNLVNRENLPPFPFNTAEQFFQKKNTVNHSYWRQK